MRRRRREPVPPDAGGTTKRRELMRLLARYELSARELSGMAGMPEKEVVAHLEHIARTVRRGGERFRVVPASCRLCGYTFRKRGRYSTPGRCPACRQGALDPPVFSIEIKDG